MSDAWISNASPLITLAAIDRFDLFAALKAEVCVPATVLNEVGAGASADRADYRVRASGRFVLVPDVAIATEVAHWGLDPGEAQAISQAIETSAKGVILDDLAGRRRVARLAPAFKQPGRATHCTGGPEVTARRHRDLRRRRGAPGNRGVRGKRGMTRCVNGGDRVCRA